MARRSAGEGTIKRRTFTRPDGTFYVRYFARITTAWDGKKQHTKDGPLREKQAEARRDLEQLKRRHQQGLLSSTSKQTLQSYVETWLERVRRARKWRTYETYRQDLTNHVLPRIGHVRLEKLHKADVQRALDEIYDKALQAGHDGAAVVRKCRAALRTALQEAVDLDLIPANPCHRVKVPAEKVSHIEIWTKAEAMCFFEVARPHRLYSLIYTTITTGLREGELLTLMWDDLHLEVEQPYLQVKRTLVRISKRHRGVAKLNPQLTHLYGEFFYNSPKTKGSEGIVSLPEDTVAVLEEHKEKQREEAEKRGNRWVELGLVFPSTLGTPLSPNSLLKSFYRLIEDAGVPQITYHDLRDTHASLLISMGLDIGTVSERLRHSTKSTTLNRYVHVVDARRRRATMSLEELFGND